MGSPKPDKFSGFHLPQPTGKDDYSFRLSSELSITFFYEKVVFRFRHITTIIHCQNETYTVPSNYSVKTEKLLVFSLV